LKEYQNKGTQFPVRGKGALEWKDKREAVLLDELKTNFVYIPVCPKVEVDMGVPREPV
jgi:uncharacterized protein YbbK (DUF523 family)